MNFEKKKDIVFSSVITLRNKYSLPLSVIVNEIVNKIVSKLGQQDLLWYY